MFQFGKRSLGMLSEVHPDLQLIMKEAIKITPIDFGITEGMRTPERARQMKDEGLSKVGDKSKHCKGLAVDIVCYNGSNITWELDFYEAVAMAVGEVSESYDIKIRWGGSWVTGNFNLNKDLDFIDAVHFELVN